MTYDREAFRRCLAIEPWEHDEMGEDIPDAEWTTTVGEVLATCAAPGSTIEGRDAPLTLSPPADILPT